MFTQPDTLIPNVYDPQSLNRYMFERGNAYKYTDPDGHYLQIAFGIAVTVLGLIGLGVIDYDDVSYEIEVGTRKTANDLLIGFLKFDKIADEEYVLLSLKLLTRKK